MKKNIQAIAFDLFDTLIVLRKSAFREALLHLCDLVDGAGFAIDANQFMEVYREEAKKAFQAAMESGQETHNSIWLSTALCRLEHEVTADDPRIGIILTEYFEEFVSYADLIPGTREMLLELQEEYQLGLLSNFTHAPAAYGILSKFELTGFFKTIIVSGDVGFRKPHPQVFSCLLDGLQTPAAETVFIGDNLVDDVQGAKESGLMPIWTTLARHVAKQDGLLLKPLGEAPADVIEIQQWNDLFAILKAF